jgi:hypothetical protein
MKEIESFENDYQNLKDEIVKNGENKQIKITVEAALCDHFGMEIK